MGRKAADPVQSKKAGVCSVHLEKKDYEQLLELATALERPLAWVVKKCALFGLPEFRRQYASDRG